VIPGRVRWLAVALPAALIAAIELVSDTIFDPYLPFPVDTLLVTAVVATLAAVFARWAFGTMDRLTTSLEARNAEIEAKAASANALHAVSQAIAAVDDLEEILTTTVRSARSLLGAELGLLVMIDSRGEPELRATSGPETAFDRTGSSGGNEASRFVHHSAGSSMLAAPLRRGGVTIGTLAVAGGAVPSHQVGDIETLSSLANQAAIAIENHRLAAELRALAVQHERERIAGEIHDGLAQVLGYVNTKSQAVEGLLEAGRLDAARSQMAELGAAARCMYVDVREAIAGLAERTEQTFDLGAEVRDYASRFAEASKLAVSVHVAPDLDTSDLTPTTRDEIVAIVKEALTNVRKHAAANRVTVTIGLEAGRLVVRIADDGRGFDPGRADDRSGDWPHYGMTTMRRRAASIDAELTWASTQGAGTTVKLIVPLDATSVRGTVAGTSPAAPALPVADEPQVAG
jgi:signal transduction histidine kinase